MAAQLFSVHPHDHPHRGSPLSQLGVVAKHPFDEEWDVDTHQGTQLGHSGPSDDVAQDDSILHHSSNAYLDGTGHQQTYISANTSFGANTLLSRLNNEVSLLEDAGEGSFGLVQKAKLDLDGQWYAVKKSKKYFLGEGDVQRRLQEVYALSVCDHPNILRYFDGWVEDKTVYIRTEWVSDGSIDSIRRPWPEEVLMSLIRQIASALHWLHCHNIAHRDIKPKNILARRAADGSHVFKLGDFGLVRPMEDESAITGEQFKGLNDDEGDERYLCPVALSTCGGGSQCNGGATDIFAFGATIVELMDGDPSKVRRGIINAASFDRYSPRLQHLVRRMTDPRPENRPTAFELFRATCTESLEERQLFAERLATVDDLQRELRDLELQLEELLESTGNSA